MPVDLCLPVPADAVKFSELYTTEEACVAALFKARWPEGFRCPKCMHAKGWRHAQQPVIECAKCGHQASAKAGTLFHAAKLPLRVLFRIVYMLVAEKGGINISEMQRQLGINYNSAMLWARKVRVSMGKRNRGKLAGYVEVDETTVGRAHQGELGRDDEGQAQVLVLVEDEGRQCGRVRLEVIDDKSRQTLHETIAKHVAKGATVHTDGLQAYRKLDDQGVHHDREVTGEPKQSHVKFPWVNRIASLLKRFILGRLHGSFSVGWLQTWLTEWEFRFNRRRAKHRPLLFNRVLQSGLQSRAPTRAAFLKLTKEYEQLGLT